MRCCWPAWACWGWSRSGADPGRRIVPRAGKPLPGLSAGLLLSAWLGLAGCASVPLGPLGESALQRIELVGVRADGSGPAGEGLRCTLRNDKGEWRLSLPGTVEVARSNAPLRIECRDESGASAAQDEVPSADERRARATRQAKRVGVIGAGGTLLFLGAVSLSPAAVLYMATGGAMVGGMAAAEQAAVDTVRQQGYGYPARIELRF